MQALHLKVDLLKISIEIMKIKDQPIVARLLGNFKNPGYKLIRPSIHFLNSTLIQIVNEERANDVRRRRRVGGREERSRRGWVRVKL